MVDVLFFPGQQAGLVRFKGHWDVPGIPTAIRGPVTRRAEIHQKGINMYQLLLDIASVRDIARACFGKEFSPIQPHLPGEGCWILSELFYYKYEITVGTSGPQQQVPKRSGHYRTSTASARSQWALHGTAGLQQQRISINRGCKT